MKSLLFFLVIIINVFEFNKSEELIFAQLYIRHGARGPCSLYDKGEDKLKVKWDGKGEITGVGERMEYLLGLRNRERYITGKYKFLSEKFDPHELVIYSSDKNRTILSMESHLQGLYPMSPKIGDKLSPEQIKVALPQVDVSYSEEIQQEIENLNDSALPHYMTIIPIHIITSSEKKILNFELSECSSTFKKMKQKNVQEKETIINLSQNFNLKYAKKMNKFYNYSEDYKYEFDTLTDICDMAIVDIIHDRNMSHFFDLIQINKGEFIKDCYEILAIGFRDELYGDDKNEMILLEASTVLRDMVSNIKRRVDADINNEKIEENASDYSKPKMVMILGHDDTITPQVLFIIKNFNLSLDVYKLPQFASQTAVEVTRNKKNNKNEKLEYSDYRVCYYFDDELYINVTLNTFIETVQKNTWTKSQIDNFCRQNDDNAHGSDDGKDKNKKDYNEKVKDNWKNNIFVYISIGLGILVLILCIVIIILIIKLRSKSDRLNERDSKDERILNNDED